MIGVSLSLSRCLCLSVSLSLCLSVSLSLCLSVSLCSLSLSVCVSACVAKNTRVHERWTCVETTMCVLKCAMDDHG